MFWILAISVTALTCAALYYAAAGRRVNASAGGLDDATSSHLRLQLNEIDDDIVAGRLGESEATAARGELAREVIRLKGEAAAPLGESANPVVLWLSLGATAILAFATYAFFGNPNLPSAPLAGRPVTDMTLEEAVARIETQLTRAPGDLRGWEAIGPAYMQLGRFADAERAFRRIIELRGATADLETNLAEAILMKQDGDFEGEPLGLLQSAIARDPANVRARFYLADFATRTGDYEAAVQQWDRLIALGTGDEPWLSAARQGREAAVAGLNGDTLPDDEAIAAMVEGLSSRLASGGGSIEEWTQLVRSRLVLGQTDLAKSAYDAARAAFPDAAVRTDLDVLAADNGLIANDP